MHIALFVPLCFALLTLSARANDCVDCPAYVDPVEIIVPKWDGASNDATTPPTQDDPAEPLMIIGETEPVLIEDIPHSFPARIDTGASICSLDTENTTFFERDGKPWVSFAVRHRETDEVFQFEKPVKRIILIKQQESETMRRPLVSLQIRMGDRSMVRDFTLADRENFEFQALLGRNFLNGVAMVDVSLSNTTATE
jgi:Uncharacterized protein conserved in archaea